MGICKNCGIHGIRGNICKMCKKYGDKIFFIKSCGDKNRKHIREDKNCETCDEYYFGMGCEESFEIQFPIIHKGCGGLIHLDRVPYSDSYSCDISLMFQCEKCGMLLNSWTEGELIDDEFEKEFNFIPDKKHMRPKK